MNHTNLNRLEIGEQVPATLPDGFTTEFVYEGRDFAYRNYFYGVKDPVPDDYYGRTVDGLCGYAFLAMDDFGNCVQIDPFSHDRIGEPFLGPSDDPDETKYVLHCPLPH